VRRGPAADERGQVAETSRHSRYLPVAAIAVIASVAGWLTTASLQQDFAAYWTAGAARRLGLSPYVNHVGADPAPALWDGVALFTHSRFLYPPLVAELFRPLAAMPYQAAKAAFTALAVAAWAAASVLAARAAAPGKREGSGVALTFAVGALAYPLYLHLERGQVDLFVLVLLLAAFAARGRPLRAGAALLAAAMLKPALIGLWPVLIALGRWRAVGAAVAGAAIALLASAALSGPALVRDYVFDVLPRAALYGEGGDETMLLPASRLQAVAGDLNAGVAHLGGRAYRQAAWDAPASASLPRLLAPERPTRVATLGPGLLMLAMLVAAAAPAHRRCLPEASEALLFWGAAVACVVASPAGWVMGLVWALPLVPWLGRLRAANAASGVARALIVAGLACACPPLFAGWAALAGTALVAAATALALTLAPRAAAAEVAR
jgi:hypothetical protein